MNRVNNTNGRKKVKGTRHNEKYEEKPVEPKKRKKKKSKIGLFFRRIFIILILIIIIFSIIFYLKVKENEGGKQGIVATLLGQSIEDIENLGRINVLLLGISEDLDSRLTDTIILCSYNPQKQTASMLSIPRDTFVGKNKNNAKGSDKINSLYSKGINKTIKAVENLTDINIDYYIVVNTRALIEIVDIIGGVEFNVPIDMDYDDPTQDLHIHLSKGMQKIDGEKAEQLLRFRHNNDNTTYPEEYGGNDYGRMRTQREFITETLKQSMSIKNLPKIREIVNTIFENIETDLNIDDIKPYIPKAVNFDLNSVISEQLPGESEKCNNVWVFIHDKKETKNMLQELNDKLDS